MNMATSYGDSFFDGAAMQAAKGPLLGGGLAKLTSLAVRKFVPSMAKHAGLAGAIVGGGVSAFLMTKPEHKETGAAGLATALIVGLSEELEQMTGLLHGADDLSAYTSAMGANALELMDDVSGDDMSDGEVSGPLEIQDSGSGSSGVMGALGAYTSEMGAVTSEMGAPDGIQIQGGIEGAFGGSF
jgi:hypothetical protein